MTEQPDIFIGISETSCPAACGAERCVISGEDICSHPFKGGLQPKYQTDKGVIERRNQARRAVAALMK